MLSIRDIAHDPGEIALFPRPPFRDGQLQGKERAILPSSGHLTANPYDFCVSCCDVIGDIIIVGITIRFRHEQADISADHLSALVSKRVLGGTIKRLDYSPIVDYDDAIHCGVNDCPILRLITLSALLCQHPLADVLDD